MSNKLKNSPIVEVACEFRFEEIAGDLTVYGEFLEKIGKEFIKKGQNSYRDIVLKQSNGKFEQEVIEYNLQRFFNEDKGILIQIGQDILIVSKMKPYTDWESYSPIINEAFLNFVDITGNRKINRVGLRYINKINFEDSTINLDDYFLFKPQINDDVLGSITGKFMVGAEFIRNSNNDLLRITFTGTEPSNGNKSAFILDFDYSTLNTQLITLDNVLSWVNNAHDEIERAFFGCITTKMQDVFNK